MTEDSVVIINGARTPVGVLLGALAAIPAPELTATAIAAALERSGVKASDIDEVFMDCVLPAALQQCPARQAAIGAGIPASAGAVTGNKACGSGMQAAILKWCKSSQRQATHTATPSPRFDPRYAHWRQ